MADDNAKKKIDEINEELGYVEETLLNIANVLSNSIKSAIEDIKDEGLKINEIFGRNLTKSINSIVKDSETFLKNTQKIFEGTAKVRDIQKDIEKLSIKRLSVERNIDILNRNGLLTDAQKSVAMSELEDAYETQNKLLQTQLSLATDIEKKYNEVTKKLGAFGGILKGIGKIPIIGDLVDTKEALTEAREETERTGSGIKGLGVGLLNLGKQFTQGITNPANIALFVFTSIIKGFTTLDKAQTEFQNQTGKTVDHFDTLNLSLITSADYIRQALSLTKELGLNALAIFSPDTIKEATEFTNLIGLGVDESNRLAVLSKVNNKELKSTGENMVKLVDNFNKTNKTAISVKSVLQDVAKTSNSISITFGNNPEKIALAAAEARKLGLTLESVNATADSLLNFESSINNEISAELITGKQLNLEKARLYALNDDLASLTKEIGTNEGIISGYVNGNRIQREAIAAAIGMSKEDLGKMIVQQQIQKGLSGDALEKATGMTLEDIKRLSAQESITKSIEKMGEALAGPLEILSKIVSQAGVIETIFIAIGVIITKQIISSISTLGAALGPIIGKLGIMTAEAMGFAAAELTANSAITFGIGAILAVGAAAYAINNMMNNVREAKKAGDIYSPANGKTQVSTKEGGLFELSKNDSLFAFPESKIKQPTSKQKQSQPIIYTDQALLDKIDKLINVQEQSNKKPITVQNSINGTQFGTAVHMNTYKTQ